MIVPLPGATRIETARSAARAGALALDAEAVAALRAHWLGEAAPAPARQGEVVVIAGMPAASKSTRAADFVARGYLRLNRDERGGTSRELARELDRAVASGADRVVLDNTYPTRASRAPIVAPARRHGLPARCLVMTTSLEQAQANAVTRMLDQFGRFLEPAELGRAAIAPNAQFRYRRAYELPRADEGFAAIEEVACPRAPTSGRAAVIVELDDLVWRGRPRTPAAIELIAGAAERLAAWGADGLAVAATTWQPEPVDAAALDARLCKLLGFALPIARCRHAAGPSCAGAASRSPASRSCSRAHTAWTSRSARTSGAALRIAASPCVRACATSRGCRDRS